MIKIAKRYGGILKKDNGKIIIETEDDIDLTIKVLVIFIKLENFRVNHTEHLVEKN